MDVNKLSEKWEMSLKKVTDKLNLWSENFNSDIEYSIANKVVDNIKYYGVSSFELAIAKLKKRFISFLIQHNASISDVFLIVDSGHGDSSHKLAYDIVKKFGIQRKNVIPLNEISNFYTEHRHCLLFNDTHGTGNQISRRIIPELKKFKFKSISIVGVAMTRTAIERIRGELPTVNLDYDVIPPSVFDFFENDEIDIIKELGAKLDRKFPLGYGNLGLLLAYYYQCPNNTIPIVWKNKQGKVIWKSLFRYNAKKEIQDKKEVIERFSDIQSDNLIISSNQYSNFSSIKNNIKGKKHRDREIMLRNYLSSLKREYLDKGDPISLYNSSVNVVNFLDNRYEKKSVNLGVIHSFLGYLLINSNLDNDVLSKAQVHFTSAVDILENSDLFTDYTAKHLTRAKWLDALSLKMRGETNQAYKLLEDYNKELSSIISEKDRLYLIRQKVLIEDNSQAYKFLDSKKNLFVNDNLECYYSFKRIFEYYVRIKDPAKGKEYYTITKHYFDIVELSLEKVYVISFKKYEALFFILIKREEEAKIILDEIYKMARQLNLVGQLNDIERIKMEI